MEVKPNQGLFTTTGTEWIAVMGPNNSFHNILWKTVYKSHKLWCLHTNARSIRNKQEELEILVQEGKFYLIGITYTWGGEELP